MTRPPKTEGEEGAGAAPTRALDRGLQILEEIAERSSMTLAEVSAACELSPATASRILRTFEARGFVSRDRETRAYRIGLKAFEVGSRFLSETRLQETCKLILRRLSSATGQSTTLAILHRSDVVYVDAHEGTSPLGSRPQIGSRAPAHATASGKCLLAGRWGDGVVEAIGPGPYAAVTDKTISSPEALRRELLAVRRNGLARESDELHPDVSCIACPVRDRSGEVIAAVAVQALTSQMASNLEAWSHLLRMAGVEASLRLGWRERFFGEPREPSASQLAD